MYYPTLEEVKKLTERGQPDTHLPRDRGRPGNSCIGLPENQPEAVIPFSWKASKAARGWPATALSALSHIRLLSTSQKTN